MRISEVNMSAATISKCVLFLSLCGQSLEFIGLRSGGGMSGLYGGMRSGARQSVSYRTAISLGCKFPMDNESFLRYMMPRGCDKTRNICPFVFTTKMKCIKAGAIGLCCPYYVSERSLQGVVMMRTYQKLSELFQM